jgi:tetratricopeptide (TPR) repeat protein
LFFKKRRKDTGEAQNLLGIKYRQEGRTVEAAQAFLLAVEAGSKHGMYNLGLLEERSGRIDSAREWLERAHAAGHPEAANNLGALLFHAGDREGAENWLRVAVYAGHPAAPANLRRLVAQKERKASTTDERIKQYRARAAQAHQLFLSSGDHTALIAAVIAARDAANLAPPGHPERSSCLIDLRDLLRFRFDLTRQLADLNEAIELGRELFAVTTPSDPRRAENVFVVVGTLRRRFEETGNEEDVAEAAEIARQSLVGNVGDELQRAKIQSSLCVLLVTLSRGTNRPADLDEAVRLGRTAVAALSDDTPDRLLALNNFGAALIVRGEQRLSGDDLDEAIEIFRMAAIGTTTSDSDRAMALANLSAAHNARASLTSGPEGVHESLKAAEQALVVEPGQWRFKATVAQAMGTDAESRDKSILLTREALAKMPAGHAASPSLLITLSRDLLARFTADGKPADLAEALEAGRSAVSSARGRAAHPAALHNLCRALLLDYQHAGKARPKLEESIQAGIAAVEATPADDPDLAFRQISLGYALLTRFEVDGYNEGLSTALEPFRAAARATHAKTSTRLDAAKVWAGYAMRFGDAADALEGAALSVELLPAVAWHGLDRETRERNLADGAALARDAAACALSAGKPERAVELLELGRSVLWAETLRLRGDFDALISEVPELVRELTRVRAALESPEHSAGEDRVMLAQQWDGLVAAVRKRPGYGTFLTGQPFSALAKAAEAGPVVIVNISQYRCDAIIVKPESTVEVVPLPSVTVPGINAITNRYLTDLRSATDPDDPSWFRGLARHTLHHTLGWLWDNIAEPVLSALEYPAREGELPRLWWCPTASLTALPLHAAGRYPKTAGSGGAVGVPFRVVSSSTPSLAALVKARLRPSSQPQTMLTVAMPDTPGGLTSLPFVWSELEILNRYFAPNAGNRQLVMPDATRADVRAQLPAHSWTHFSCHSGQDLTKPSEGALHLWDGPMTVLEIAEQRLDRAELAFLSACQTVIGGTELLDESIHLAAALQLAGYRHVVATLWSIYDQTSPAVTEAFYRLVTAGGMLDSAKAARALHEAVRLLRSEYPADPTFWASYLHVGP